MGTLSADTDSGSELAVVMHGGEHGVEDALVGLATEGDRTPREVTVGEDGVEGRAHESGRIGHPAVGMAPHNMTGHLDAVGRLAPPATMALNEHGRSVGLDNRGRVGLGVRHRARHKVRDKQAGADEERHGQAVASGEAGGVPDYRPH